MTTARQRRRMLGMWAWLPPLAIASITFLAFAPALRAGFVAWDDQSNFLENLHYRGLAAENLKWMWSSFLLGHYVPLSWMTLGLDYVIWGMNPFGYHLTSLLLHSANAVLLYFVARRLLVYLGVVDAADSPRLNVAAAIATLLYSVHPLRVESVVWVTERRDVLSAFFYLWTLLLYFRYIDSGSKKGALYWAALATFACALLSKGTAVTLPPVLLVLNVYPLRRLRVSELWSAQARSVYVELLPFVVFGAADIMVTFVALQAMHQLAPFQKVAVSAYGLVFYLWKTIVPTGLAPLYDMPQQVNPLEPQYVISYIVVIALTIIALIAARRRPGITLAWVLFVLILFPLLGVHQNGPQIAADRYTYDAAPALTILLAAGWATLGRTKRAASTVGAAALIAVLSVLTWRQSEIWHDSVAMWSKVLTLNPESSVTLTALGNLESKAGNTVAAIDYYQRSLAVAPDSPEAENNLGIALARDHRLAEALPHYQRAAGLRANYYEAENNWGLAIADLRGDLDEAIEHYRRAVVMNPDYADAHVNWGNALVQRGDFDGAIAHYQTALRIQPDDADAYRNWGVALARQNRFDEAIDKFRQALALRPDFADAQQMLDRAVALQKQRGSTSRRP